MVDDNQPQMLREDNSRAIRQRRATTEASEINLLTTMAPFLLLVTGSLSLALLNTIVKIHKIESLMDNALVLLFMPQHLFVC